MSELLSTRRRPPSLRAILFGKPDAKRSAGHSCHCYGRVPAHVLEMRPQAAGGPPHCPGCGCWSVSMPPHLHDWPEPKPEERTVLVEQIIEHAEQPVIEGTIVTHRLNAPEPVVAVTTGRRVLDPFGIGDLAA